MTSPDPVTEAELIADADRRAQRWLTDIGARPVFQDRAAIDAVRALDARLTDTGRPATETIELLDEVAGLATVASNDPRYFGFVIGATLPVAAAADRIALASDQCASSFDNSPAAHLLERHAARLVLDAVLTALATACRSLLARHGWDIDRRGLRRARDPRRRLRARARHRPQSVAPARLRSRYHPPGAD
jgi:hypothetical protein